MSATTIIVKGGLHNLVGLQPLPVADSIKRAIAGPCSGSKGDVVAGP